MAKASVIGTSHEKTGLPCQDSSVAFLCQMADQSYAILAVSDGAGSAKHSDVGSHRTAHIFADLAQDHIESGKTILSLDRNMMLEWISVIRADLEAHALEMNRQPRDYSCTLLAAIIGEASAAFVQIGDGAIVVSHGEEDGWSYINWPQHGEFANSTNFIFSSNVPEVMEFEVNARSVKSLALFTDGIENLVLHSASKSVHQPFFSEMIKPLQVSKLKGLDQDLSRKLAGYLASTRVCSKTDDDKSLILVTRCPE